MGSMLEITDIQKCNYTMVVETLLYEGPISRMDLSRTTGLNKGTISNIIQDFISRGIAEEVGAINSNNGRKVTGVSLKLESVVSIIIRITADQICFCTSTVHGDLENCETENYNSDTDDPSKIIELIVSKTKALEKSLLKSGKKILGIGIATLGWLFRTNGKLVIKADIAPVLAKLNLKKLFKSNFPEFPVFIEHDAKVSALAEFDTYCRETGNMPQAMLNIVGDIGLGGGIVINGEVYSGYSGIAGEVGHLGINPLQGGFTSSSGSTHYTGLLENYSSPLAIRQLILENLAEFQNTILTAKSTLEEIYKAYDDGDTLAEFCINKTARYLAYGLTGIIFVLNPQVIVLSDKMIKSQKYYDRLNYNLKMLLPKELYEVTEIRFSRYQEKGVLIGTNLGLLKYLIKTRHIAEFLNLEFQE